MRNTNEIGSIYKSARYLWHNGNGIIIRILRFLSIRLRILVKRIKYLPDKLWKKNIYLMCTEDFGNLGDHIIAETEIKFLKDYYYNYNIVECTASLYWSSIAELSYRIKHSDLIFITGGGNMGDMYPFSEAIRTDVIKRFKSNRIVIFPQTVFFNDMKNAEKYACDYEVCSRLIVSVREQYSFDICNRIFSKAKVLLMPDIVLYNDQFKSDVERKHIRLCLRKDQERTICDDDYDKIKLYVGNFGLDLEEFDMQLDFNVNKGKRKEYIKQIMKLYNSAYLIITDRLHPMIISAITETPCVAIGSKSYKMKGTYNWLKDFNYIEYVDEVDRIPQAIEKVTSIKKRHYSNERFKPYFEQIIKTLNEVK